MILRFLGAWRWGCALHVYLLDWPIPASSIDLLWLFPVIGDRSWSYLFSPSARLFFAFSRTCVVCKSFCDLSSHIFLWPLPSGHSYIHSQQQPSCYIYSAVNTTTTTIATSIATTEDAHQQIRWMAGRGQGHHHHHHRYSFHCRAHACVYVCMCVCISLCKVGVGKQSAWKCIPLCVSHSNVMRAFTNATLSNPCNAWLMDGWLWWMAWVIRCSFLWTSDGEEMLHWLNEWMNACMDWLLCVCVCVWSVVSLDVFAGRSSLHF